MLERHEIEVHQLGGRPYFPVGEQYINIGGLQVFLDILDYYQDIDKLLNHFLLTANLRPCNREAAETKTQRKLGANNPWSNTIFVKAPLVPGNLTTFSNTRYHDLPIKIESHLYNQ